MFPIRIRTITVQMCGNFWVTQYVVKVARQICLFLKKTLSFLAAKLSCNKNRISDSVSGRAIHISGLPDTYSQIFDSRISSYKSGRSLQQSLNYKENFCYWNTALSCCWLEIVANTKETLKFTKYASFDVLIFPFPELWLLYAKLFWCTKCINKFDECYAYSYTLCAF